jgi:hypothetical protein
VSVVAPTRIRPPAACTGDALAQIGRDLAAIDTDELHPSQARAVVAHLARLRNQIDAIDVDVIAGVDRSGQWQIDGSRSVTAWVRNVSESTRGSASRRIEAGRVSKHIPHMTEEFRSGHTSLEHIGIVARAASVSDARTDALPEVDPIFARLASRTTPEQLKRAVDLWASHVDAKTFTEEFSDRAERAHLHVSTTMNKMVRLDGLLDPETGAAFIAALAATRDKLNRARPSDIDGDGDSARPSDSDGDGADQSGRPGPPGPSGQPGASSMFDRLNEKARRRRRASEQNVDALRHLLGLAVAHPTMATGTGGIPVHIAVTTSLDALKASLAHVGLPDGVNPPLLRGAGDSIGTGIHIPAATARRLACDAEILPVVMNSRSQVLDVGRRTRLISPALRLAIELRDEHCRFPRCDAPIQEVHHLIFWANGGRTDQTNLAGLCRHHHHTVHERGFTLTGNANHDLTLTPP